MPRLKNQLPNDEQKKEEISFTHEEDKSYASTIKKRVFILVIVLFLGYTAINGVSSFNFGSFKNPITNINAGGSSESLLKSMNELMAEMGYSGLDFDQLRSLRSDGVTATYIANVRALGFTDLTLEQASSLAKANVSTAFIAMMQELGYQLEIEDFIALRRAGVTAHLTSNLHDMGYKEVTPDQLIRIRRIGVTPELVKRLQSERGQTISMEEIIRYRISNQ